MFIKRLRTLILDAVLRGVVRANWMGVSLPDILEGNLGGSNAKSAKTAKESAKVRVIGGEDFDGAFVRTLHRQLHSRSLNQVMPSNYNWVCFTCRVVIRRPSGISCVPNCPDCGSECFFLGHKVAVPNQRNKRAWRELHLDCRERELSRREKDSREKVRLTHDIEKEITRMNSLPSNAGRRSYIKGLEAWLDKVRNS
jgi:hypothetical protein